MKLVGTLDVVEPGFPERQLKVAGKYVKPPESVKAQMAEDRAALLLQFHHDLTDAEVGRCLGVSMTAARSRIHRAALPR